MKACALLAGLALLAAAFGCGEDEPAGGDDPAARAGAAGAPESSIVRPLEACSIAHQDCEGDGLKCTVIQEPSLRPACARAGAREQGESCTRLAIGDDDCAAGAWCTPLTEAAETPRAHTCRKLCDANGQCGASERCYRFSTGLGILGVCAPECQPFATECAQGLHCLPVLDAASQLFFICNPYGDVPLGGSCSRSEECGPGLVCAEDSRRCRSFCAAEHPCEIEGETCKILIPPALGVCDPE